MNKRSLYRRIEQLESQARQASQKPFVMIVTYDDAAQDDPTPLMGPERMDRIAARARLYPRSSPESIILAFAGRTTSSLYSRGPDGGSVWLEPPAGCKEGEPTDDTEEPDGAESESEWQKPPTEGELRGQLGIPL